MSRIARVLTAAVLVAGAATTGVVALDDPQEQTRAKPAASIGAGSVQPDREQLKALSSSASAKTRKAAIRGRERSATSRSAHRDLSGPQALSVARDAFPELVDTKAFRAVRPQKDTRLIKLNNVFEAQVVTGKGQRLQAKSTAPLAVRDRDGKLSPVDMTLERTAAGDFAPRNAPATATLGSTADEGIHLQDADVTVAPAGARAATGVRSADNVFYPNIYGADKDTDLVTEPSDDTIGAQVHWVLRSPRAPMRLPLDLDVPEGASLRMAIPEKEVPGMQRSIEVVKGDESLAFVSAPLAYDADGRTVPATHRIVGDQIIVDVEHAKSNYRFPIWVDPIASNGLDAFVYRDYDHKTWNGSSPEWFWTQWGTNQYANIDGDPAYGGGMVSTMPTYRSFPPRGSGAKWFFTAPAGTKTNNFVMSGMEFKSYDFYGYKLSISTQGLANPGATAWLTGDYRMLQDTGHTGPNPSVIDRPSYAGRGRQFYCYSLPACQEPGIRNVAQAVFQADNNLNNNPINTGGQSAFMRVHRATVFLQDNENPTIQNVTTPSSAWRSGGATTVTAQIRDDGVGPHSLTASGVSGIQTAGEPNDCADVRYNRPVCAYAISYTAPEGISTVTLNGKDKSGKQAPAYSWTERIDNTAPVLQTPTGDLWTERDTTAFEEGGSFSISATDGDPASSASQRSGVRTIEVSIDGEPMTNQRYERECTRPEASCDGTLNFVFDTVAFAPGEHTVSVTATDQVGNVSTPNVWTVAVGAGDPNDKASYWEDAGADADDLGTVDNESDACPADPDAGADGQYCNADDTNNDADIFERQATSTSATELKVDGSGWGIADQNVLVNTFRPVPGGSVIQGMFVDPLFDATNVKTVRRLVPWDIVDRGTTPRSTPMGYTTCRNGQPASEDLTSRGTPNGVSVKGDETVGTERSELDKFHEWYTAAVADGMSVMVSFERTYARGANCYLPSRAQYRSAIRAFRNRYPKITLYTSWNEPNHKTQPTQSRFDDRRSSAPAGSDGLGYLRAGQFWTDLKKECQSVRNVAPVGQPPVNTVKCTVGAGEFLDDTNMTTKPYKVGPKGTGGGLAIRKYVSGLNGQEPSVWAWHAYSAGYKGLNKAGAPVDRPAALDRLIAYINATDYKAPKTDPKIWLTEQGGRFDQHLLQDNRLTKKNVATMATAAQKTAALSKADDDLRYLLNIPGLASTKGRITKFLAYSWMGSTVLGQFDSGLLDALDPNKAPRAMYNTFKAKVSSAP